MARLIILRILDSYFRHRWLNLLPLVIMIALGAASFYVAKPQYTSHGRIYVQKASLLPSLTQIQVDGYSWQSPTQLAVNEFNELVQTEAFARAVIQKTDLESTMSNGVDAFQQTLDQYRQSLSVLMVGDNLIEVTVQSENPKLAQQFASATIDAYIQWKLNADQQESAVAQQFFANVIPPYQTELQRTRDQLQAYLKSHPETLRGERPAEEQIEINRLQTDIDTAAKRVEDAMAKEESARLSQTQAESNVRQNYLLIDAPLQPTTPKTSLKDRVTGPIIFSVVGMFLTVMCVLGAALLDRSFRFALDVRSNLALPVLASVPDMSRVAQPAVVNEPTYLLNQRQQPRHAAVSPQLPALQPIAPQTSTNGTKPAVGKRTRPAKNTAALNDMKDTVRL